MTKVVETFATRAVLVLLGLISSVLVARILEPAGRGIFAAATVVSAMGVQFGNIGLHASNSFYAARTPAVVPELVGNSLLVSIVVGGGGAGITGLLFWLWPELAPVQGTLLLLITLLWIPVGLANMLVLNILLGLQQVRFYNKVELVSRTLSVVLVVLVFLGGAVSVSSVFTAGLVAVFVSLIWVLFLLRPFMSRKATLSLSMLRSHMGYGLSAYLAALFSFLVLKVDLLLVKQWLGAEEAGLYSISATMADMVYMLPQVVGTVLFPKLSALTDLEERWTLTKRSALGVVAAMIPVMAFSMAMAVPVVRLLFGEEFLPSVPYFLWLMPGIMFLALGTVLQNFIGGTGHALGMVWGPLAACLVNLVLNAFLIPMVGAVGAAYSSSIAYGLLAVTSYLVSHRLQLTVGKERRSNE